MRRDLNEERTQLISWALPGLHTPSPPASSRFLVASTRYDDGPPPGGMSCRLVHERAFIHERHIVPPTVSSVPLIPDNFVFVNEGWYER